MHYKDSFPDMISVINNSGKLESIGDDDHMYLISQMYEDTSSQQAAPSAGDRKTRRRKRGKNSKACSGGVDDSEAAALRKRKLSEEQVRLLELNFGTEHKLESERKDRLAAELGLDPRQVAVWFQNRRARWKAKKLEEEYSKLKAAHDSLVLRNCQLESQVMKLEERLAVEENEVRRLSEGASSNSPTSCLSMEATDGVPLFLDGFGIIEEGLIPNVFYNLQESGNNYRSGPVEWANLYGL